MKKLTAFLRGLGLLLVVAIGVAMWIVVPWQGLLALAVVFALWMALTRRGRQAGSITRCPSVSVRRWW